MGGAHTYLIRSVVESVEAQVPLGKRRRWTEGEGGRVTEARRCAAPSAGGTLGTGLGTVSALTRRANVCSQTPLNLRVSTQVISVFKLAVGF